MSKTVSLTRRRIVLGAASVILGDLVLKAQDMPRVEKPLFSVDVQVVNVFVTVRDKKGNIVRGLMIEDFLLSEDGRPQTIRYFSKESDLPLTIGLIVDMTPSESKMLEVEKSASRTFFNKMLRPEKDRAFLIQFGGDVELLQDLTSSREELDGALNRLERRSSSGGENSTELADAIYLASQEIMSKQQGRKALIILGDGDHVGGRTEMAIAAAQEVDTLVYAIGIFDKKRFGGNGGGWQGPGGIPGIGGIGQFGLGGGMPGGGGGQSGPGAGIPGGGGPGSGGDRSNGKSNLQKLSQKTGGAYFEAGGKDTLEAIFSKIEEELRSQYNLGYTPGNSDSSGYHKIKVDARKKRMIVRSREGYYSKPKPSSRSSDGSR